MKKLFFSNLIISAAFLAFIATNCKKEKSAGEITQCATIEATNVKWQCATLNARVSHDDAVGAAVVFEYGVTTAYGSIAEPYDDYLSTGTKNVFADVACLSAATEYHFRVKAVNGKGTVFGDDMTFSTAAAPGDYSGETGTVADADGNVYHTIGIGSQVWMAENLKTTTYQNGDVIGTTMPSTLDISGESAPEYQWAYAGDESNISTYGRLYTWHAATDSRNVCPAGWHIPSNNEWIALTDYLMDNCYGYIGKGRTNIARSLAAPAWYVGYSATPGNNTSGFTALPGGYREADNNNFYGISIDGYWWSSAEYSTGNAIYMSISMTKTTTSSYHENMHSGLSVRCVKDI